MYANINASPISRGPFGGLETAAAVASVEFEYQKGSEVFGASERAEYVYQVIEGAVRTYKLLSDGRRQIAAFHLAGDVFGWEFDEFHRFSADAVVSTRLRLVKQQSVQRLAESDAATLLSLQRTTSTDLQQAEDHLLLLGQKSALERVANFLVEMERRSTCAGVTALPMSRLDIADYLGLTLETVSRAIAGLKKKNLIEVLGASQRDIVVADIDGLAEIDAH